MLNKNFTENGEYSGGTASSFSSRTSREDSISSKSFESYSRNVRIEKAIEGEVIEGWFTPYAKEANYQDVPLIFNGKEDDQLPHYTKDPEVNESHSNHRDSSPYSNVHSTPKENLSCSRSGEVFEAWSTPDSPVVRGLPRQKDEESKYEVVTKLSHGVERNRKMQSATTSLGKETVKGSEESEFSQSKEHSQSPASPHDDCAILAQSKMYEAKCGRDLAYKDELEDNNEQQNVLACSREADVVGRTATIIENNDRATHNLPKSQYNILQENHWKSLNCSEIEKDDEDFEDIMINEDHAELVNDPESENIDAAIRVKEAAPAAFMSEEKITKKSGIEEKIVKGDSQSLPGDGKQCETQHISKAENDAFSMVATHSFKSTEQLKLSDFVERKSGLEGSQIEANGLKSNKVGNMAAGGQICADNTQNENRLQVPEQIRNEELAEKDNAAGGAADDENSFEDFGTLGAHLSVGSVASNGLQMNNGPVQGEARSPGAQDFPAEDVSSDEKSFVSIASATAEGFVTSLQNDDSSESSVDTCFPQKQNERVELRKKPYPKRRMSRRVSNPPHPICWLQRLDELLLRQKEKLRREKKAKKSVKQASKKRKQSLLPTSSRRRQSSTADN